MTLFKRQDKSIRKTVYSYQDLQNAMNLCENESLKSYLVSFSIKDIRLRRWVIEVYNIYF